MKDRHGDIFLHPSAWLAQAIVLDPTPVMFAKLGEHGIYLSRTDYALNELYERHVHIEPGNSHDGNRI